MRASIRMILGRRIPNGDHQHVTEKLKKNQQRPCPYQEDSEFCAGTCADLYFCQLPKLASQNEWRKKTEKVTQGLRQGKA